MEIPHRVWCWTRIQPLQQSTEVLTEADIEEIQQTEHTEKKTRMLGRSAQDSVPLSMTTIIVTMFRDHLCNSWGLEAPVAKTSTAHLDGYAVAEKLQKLFELRLEEMSNTLNSVSEQSPNFEADTKGNSLTRSLENKYSTPDYLTAAKGLEMVEDTVVTASVLDCKDGTYMVAYEPRLAGEYSWTIVHNGLDVSPGDEVVHVSPGIINERASVIYGFGVHQAMAGQLSHFVLQVRLTPIPVPESEHTQVS